MISRFVPWMKFIPPLIILLLVAALAVQTSRVKHRQQELDIERQQRSELATKVGAENNWPSIRAHLEAVVTTNNNRGRALAEIDQATKSAVIRNRQLDEALKKQQTEHQRQFLKAQQTINQLVNNRSSGNAATDCAMIDKISRLPWSGWHGETL